MTDEELINKVIDLYQEARVTTILRKNIKRGRNHSVSSKVEDLFAVYIAELISDSGALPEDIELLIDQPFTYQADKTYSIYPDISVIVDKKIVKLFDIKMDLGWNRNFFPFCHEKEELVGEIRNKETKAKDGATKEQKSYTFSPTIKYNVVIVSNENISQDNRENNQQRIATLDQTKIEVFI